LNLCFLYYKTSSYPYVENLLNAFDDSATVDINNINNIGNYDVYIIELDNVDNDISLKLVNIFKKNQNPLIYFVVPHKYNLTFLQLICLLNIKSIITHKQNIDKVISKINIDRNLLNQYNFENWLGNAKIKTQKFIIYKNEHLVFINKLILKLFKFDTENEFKKNILSRIDIKKLLNIDTTLVEDISNSLDITKRYTFKSVSISDYDKIIYIEENNEKKKELDFISSKISFIELLKENILQRNIHYKELSILTIKIDMKRLLNKYTVVEVENILVDLLIFMESILENKLILSQFENEFYMVLLKDINFQELNVFAENFHNKVLKYVENKNKNIIIDLFTLNINSKEFAEILTILNQISNESFNKNQINAQDMKYFTISNFPVDAKTFLDDAYINASKIKILNIYNGLVINTSSEIIKITKENIHITFEPLHGVTLNLEKKTVLQSDSFSQDIYAELKQINFNKKIAILENFKFLKTNANSRKYARVTTSIHLPIAINFDGVTVHGFILDISIKSIAIKVKYTPKIAMVKLKKAYLIFNISDELSENGYIQLNLESKVISVTEVDKTGHYKVICDLNQENYNLDIISKYVYQRQKELIIELKKMSKLN